MELKNSINASDPDDPGNYLCTCDVGSYQTSALECSACGDGKYKASTGTQACTACDSEDYADVLFTTVDTISEDNCTCRDSLVEIEQGGKRSCTCPAGTSFEEIHKCIGCNDFQKEVKLTPGMHGCHACPDYLKYQDASACTWHTENVCEDPEYFTFSQDNPGSIQNVDISENPHATRITESLSIKQATFLAYYFLSKYCNPNTYHFTQPKKLISSLNQLKCHSMNITGQLKNVTETKKTKVFNRLLAPKTCNMPAYNESICALGQLPTLYYDPATTQVEAGCVPCPVGHGYMPGLPRDTCTQCPPATFLNVSSGTCTPCPAGTYQDKYGQKECHDCPKNTFNYLQGQQSQFSCLPCPDGKFTQGKRQTSVTACKPCPGAFVFSKKFEVCQPCELGYEKQNETCMKCPIGSYRVSEHTRNCTKCPMGTTTRAEGSTSPDDCVCAGNSSTTCCPSGQEYNSTTQQCVRCGIQKYKREAGTHACQQCVGGTIATPSAQFCICSEPILHYGHCQPYGSLYPYGYQRNENTFNAWIDPYFGTPKIENQDSSSLLMQIAQNYAHGCPEMQGGGQHYLVIIFEFNNDTMLTLGCHSYDYYTCQKENFVRDLDDEYLLGGTRTITIIQNATKECPSSACPPGYAPDASGACVCARGHGRSAAERCEPCPPNTFQSHAGLEPCRPCPPNSTSADNRTRCTCPASAHWTDDDRCEECMPGFGRNTSQESCEACEAGKYRKHGMPACEACPDKQYSKRGDTECKKCAPGQKGRANKMLCEDCPPGSFIADDAADCKVCSGNTFQPNAKSSTCLSCPVGTRGDASLLGRSCKACGDGEFLHTGNNTCKKCDEGKFPAINGTSVTCIEREKGPKFDKVKALVQRYQARNDTKVIFQAVRPGASNNTIAELDVHLFFGLESNAMRTFEEDLENNTYLAVVEERTKSAHRRLLQQDAEGCETAGCDFLVRLSERVPAPPPAGSASGAGTGGSSGVATSEESGGGGGGGGAIIPSSEGGNLGVIAGVGVGILVVVLGLCWYCNCSKNNAQFIMQI